MSTGQLKNDFVSVYKRLGLLMALDPKNIISRSSMTTMDVRQGR